VNVPATSSSALPTRATWTLTTAATTVAVRPARTTWTQGQLDIKALLQYEEPAFGPVSGYRLDNGLSSPAIGRPPGRALTPRAERLIGVGIIGVSFPSPVPPSPHPYPSY
jgi:hypothetical protein